MARTGKSLIIVAIAVTLAVAAPSTAVGGGGVRAIADGASISLELASRMSCYDFDHPVLTCFATASEMEAAAAARAGRQTTPTVPGGNAPATSGYVVVYENGAFGGAAQAISQDYGYLGTISWNDRISSLKSYGASGHFTENAPTGGFSYDFYATSQYTYVGDYYNDKFSAVYLN